MNEKNSLDLDNCFKELKNPIDLFREWFNEAVKNEASAEEVGRIAAENKMKTLQQAALNYVLRGDTSVEEINRVL